MECIRPGAQRALEGARRLVKGYVEHCKNVRLNGAIGYITTIHPEPGLSLPQRRLGPTSGLPTIRPV